MTSAAACHVLDQRCGLNGLQRTQRDEGATKEMNEKPSQIKKLKCSLACLLDPIINRQRNVEKHMSKEIDVEGKTLVWCVSNWSGVGGGVREGDFEYV